MPRKTHWLAALSCGSLFATSAHALPTPDAFISVVNLAPLATAGAAAAAGSLVVLLRRIFGRRGGELAVGLSLGLAVAIATAAGFLAERWMQDREDARIQAMAVYLRCDVDFHEHLRAPQGNGEEIAFAWAKQGHFRTLPMEQVAERLAKQPDAALFATNRLGIRYDSGIPVVRTSSGLRPFEHVRRADLAARLAELEVRDLYLTSFGSFRWHPETYPELDGSFEKFDNIYLVTSLADSDLYVDDGGLRPVDRDTELIDWPLEKEGIVDEARVAYPRMTTLLPDATLARYLEDDETYLLAPYDTEWRDRGVYLDVYLRRLLVEKERSLVIGVNLNSDGIDGGLEQVAEILDGKPFAIVGLTKYDWTDQGMDLGYQIWERLDRDPDRFQLRGFGPRLPEAAAVLYAKRGRNGALEALAPRFWEVLLHGPGFSALPPGLAVLAAAVGLRLLFLPIGILESRSRMLRVALERRRNRASGSPAWSGSSATLLRQLGAGRYREAAGALLTLVLVLPAYRLLTSDSAPASVGFLWIDDLAHTDLALVLGVAGLILLKLVIGDVHGFRWWHAAAAGVFALVLLWVPAVVLLWVLGVLSVTTAQDLAAWIRSDRRLRLALLEAAHG